MPSVSTVAFPFWAYLTNAVAFAKFHDGDLAVILIATFTVVSGLVSPMATKAKVAEQQQAATGGTGRRLIKALTSPDPARGVPRSAIAGGRRLVACVAPAE